MILSYGDLQNIGERHNVTATVTTEHPASSYGLPVIVLADGEALDPASWILLGYQVEYIGDPSELAALHQALRPYVDVVDDLDEPLTICDRCGSEIPVSEANYAGSELPTWEGATLCNDCYADENAEVSP